MLVQSSTLSSQGAPPSPVVKRVSIDPPNVVSTTSHKAGPSPEQMAQAVSKINKAMQVANQGLEFSLDPDTKEPIVRVVDGATGEVIRQIPSEETLAIARAIDQFQQGLLLRAEA
jgi:flagellar protein FlaG